jgi:hypothetical protein
MIQLTQEFEKALRLAIRNATACPMHFFKEPSSKAVQHVKYCEMCEDIIVAGMIETLNHAGSKR